MAPGKSERDLSRPVESGSSARVILIAGICQTAGMEGAAVGLPLRPREAGPSRLAEPDDAGGRSGVAFLRAVGSSTIGC